MKHTPATPDIETLIGHIPLVFSQVQHSQANHKKNVVAMLKIQEECSLVVQESSSGKGPRLIGEKAFNNTFIDMVNRILPLKRGISPADKCAAFIAKYVAYATEQDAANRTNGEEDEEEPESTVTSRFIEKLIMHLLSGCEAKDKNVRYRVVQLLWNLIEGMGQTDDDTYQLLRSALLDRSNDKEAPIRVQAVMGLALLAAGEDPADREEGEQSLQEVLVDAMRFDDSADVRRAVMYSIRPDIANIAQIIARSRDVDPIIRRSVYLKALSPRNIPDPRVLSIMQRELVVKNGLGDREPSVRRATGYMLGDWHTHAQGDIIEFLKRFDVVESKTAEAAFDSLLTAKPELLDQMAFDDTFWESMTPEKAFMARIFVDHCKSIKKDDLLERSLPSVTSLAFRIQDEYNQLDSLQPPPTAAEDLEQDEQMLASSSAYLDKAFVISEMCKLALILDYSDELGRRKMFQLAREMISHPALPDLLIPGCLSILSKISDSERDLIRLVVDVVTELRAVDDDDGASSVPAENQSYASSMRAPRRQPRRSAARDDLISPQQLVERDMRCLAILIRLLETVNGTLQQNAVLQGLIEDLIAPAIGNKRYPDLQARGLLCLGLCGTLETRLASMHFKTVWGYAIKAPGEQRLVACKVVFDWLMTHGVAKCFETLNLEPDKYHELIQPMLQQPFAEIPEVAAAAKAIAAEGAAKLMLAGMITDAKLLHTLVIMFTLEENADNLALKQCLSYFFPVFCYSSSANQRLMLEVADSTLATVATGRIAAAPDEHKAIGVSLAQAAVLLIDWTDPMKVVEREGMETDGSIHIDLAVEFVKLLSQNMNRDFRKTLAAQMSKLYMPDEVDELKIKSLMVLLRNVQSRRPLVDAAPRNALKRFEDALEKKYPQQLEGLSTESLREVEGLFETFEFMDALGEADDDSDEYQSSKAKSEDPPSRRTSVRAAAGRARKSLARIEAVEEEDEDEDDGVDDEEAAGEDGGGGESGSSDDDPVARKKIRGRPPAVKSRGAAKVAGSDSETVDSILEEEEDDGDESF